MSKIRGIGFKSTMKISDALRCWINKPQKMVETELIPAQEASHRILAEDIVASIDVPRFDRAAMDGYAVIAEDTLGASPTTPQYLNVIRAISITGPSNVDVQRGEAVTVTTGSPLPPKCNAVVMLEYAKEKDRKIEIFCQVAPWENVTKKGDDIKKGSKVFKKGHRIIPPDIGVLKNLGKDHVQVSRKPRIAIITTGNELVESLTQAQAHDIVDVNSPVLSALIQQEGGVALDLGITKDDETAIEKKLKEADQVADFVLITGGTSVGPKDIIPGVVKRYPNSEITVHGISMRPGMPTGLGYLNGKPLVTIPGNPVAAIVAFLNFVKPQISMLAGGELEESMRIRCVLNRRVTTRAGMRYFVRVHVFRMGDEYRVDPIMVRGSSILSSMVRANGILEIPEEIEGYEAGDTVEVTLLRPLKKVI
ncbi:molybdopterin molybdotransferase MoeA [[Eubacterium] cellulosolvens]